MQLQIARDLLGVTEETTVPGIRAAYHTKALFLLRDMDNVEASFDLAQLLKAMNVAVNHKCYEALGITDFCVPPKTIQTLVAFLTLFSNDIVHSHVEGEYNDSSKNGVARR